jgi:hypothetical protein
MKTLRPVEYLAWAQSKLKELQGADKKEYLELGQCLQNL